MSNPDAAVGVRRKPLKPDCKLQHDDSQHHAQQTAIITYVATAPVLLSCRLCHVAALCAANHIWLTVLCCLLCCAVLFPEALGLLRLGSGSLSALADADELD